MKRYLILFVSTILLAVSCGKDNGKTVDLRSLSLEQTNLFIKVGESRQLVVKSEPKVDITEFKFTSGDESIAKVDSKGVVTGVAPGSVNIRVSYNGVRQTKCLVNVGTGETKMLDFSKSLAKPLSADMILHQSVLYAGGNIMQDGDLVTDKGPFYFTQNRSSSSLENGSKYLVHLTCHSSKNATYTSYNNLKWFGHGQPIQVENTGEGVYIWTPCLGNATYGDYADYGTHKAFCRFKYENNKTLEHYAGDVYFGDTFTDMNGAKVTYHSPEPAIDFENRRMLIGARTSGARVFVVYDLDQVLALKPESVTITRSWGGEEGKPKQTNVQQTITARNLNSLKPLGSCRFSSYMTAKNDPANVPYNYNSQGFAVVGDYLYWFEGNALEGTSQGGQYDGSIAYVTCFDYAGNIKYRTRVAAVSDFTAQERLLDCKDHYCEAEGLHIHGNSLYLGFGVHNSAGKRVASLIKYTCE